MRRLALILGTGAAALLVVILGFARGGGGDSTYRVDVIFDSAKGMVPGQAVKVAGAKAGTVTGVRLAPGPSARLELNLDSRFARFSADARCKILPEGFISERYVECDPGSPAKPKLPEGKSGVPTVSRSRTAVPVALQDVINIFSVPVDQRVRLLLNELGIATAGRGADLNAILRRSNPALSQAGRVLSIVDAQRTEVTRAVVQTDRVLARLARDQRDVRGFVKNLAAVTRTTAAHHTALGQSVRDLPPMLRAMDLGLASLRRVATDGTPLVRDLRAAAPGVRRLTSTLPAFARAGTPAVRALGDAAATGRRSVRSARPVVSSLRSFATRSRPVVTQLRQLTGNLRETGGIEAVLNLGYALAGMSAGFDGVSHMAGVYIGLYPQCLLSTVLSVETAGCKHSFTAPGKGTVPVNAPSAGPQMGGNTALGPVASPPRVGSDARGSTADPQQTKPTPQQTKAFLDYLLK